MAEKNTPGTPQAKAASPAHPGAHPESKDAFRESVETVVFVVVLVLLLKTFVAEAFVIPTGSMAVTLLGYQKNVTCPECNYLFPVNCSSEAEADDNGNVHRVEGCVCPQCRYEIDFQKEKGLKEKGLHPNWTAPDCISGDRVLVSKFHYDSGLSSYRAFDVVVFKFPEGPQKNYTPMNYIKRLIGRPGETIGIRDGNIFTSKEWSYREDRAEEPFEPIRRMLHKDDKRSLLEEGSPLFQIQRKPPDKILPLSRLVYDNDYPAKDLVEQKFPPRWAPEKDAPEDWDAVRGDRFLYERKRQRAEADLNAWQPAAGNGFQHAARTGHETAWLRYRHLLRKHNQAAQGRPKPQLITDFMGYNSGAIGRGRDSSQNWVGDLILECDVTVQASQGELILELCKGVDRFQAHWDLQTGKCTLRRLTFDKSVATAVPKIVKDDLASKVTKVNAPGTYRLRFANVDERLTLWVNRDLPFDDGVTYSPPTENDQPHGALLRTPTPYNDLEPAAVGVVGAGIAVSHLKLSRDTYYTNPSSFGLSDDVWEDPTDWEEKLGKLPAQTYYVQPGHYFCLGDNSPHSSDGRSWAHNGGLVPERLMLGRALLVYYPFYCPVWPLNNPVNRVGLIR